MALCGEKLAGLVATSRLGGHFPPQLGNRFVFVSGLCLRQFTHNANNISCYRRSGLWHFSDFCWIAR